MKKHTQKGLKNRRAIWSAAIVMSFCLFSVARADQTIIANIPVYNNKFYGDAKKERLTFLGGSDSKILDSTKEQLDVWNDQRTHMEDWNLGSTGIYKLPSHKQQASFVGSRFVRFFDKWISKKAKEKDANVFKKAHKAQKTLNPKKKLSLSNSFKLSFGTHLLRARAFMVLENTYFDYITTASPSRGVDIRVGKSLGKSGLRTDVNYNMKGHFEASINRPIVENLYARLSTASHEGHSAFSRASNNVVQLQYSKGL